MTRIILLEVSKRIDDEIERIHNRPTLNREVDTQQLFCSLLSSNSESYLRGTLCQTSWHYNFDNMKCLHKNLFRRYYRQISTTIVEQVVPSD